MCHTIAHLKSNLQPQSESRVCVSQNRNYFVGKSFDCNQFGRSVSAGGMASISRYFYRSGFIPATFSKSGAVVHSHQWNAVRLMSSSGGTSRLGANVKGFLKWSVVGVLAGTGIAGYTSFKPKENHFHQAEVDYFVIDRIPNVPIARKIVNENDKTNLDLVLFQYQTCPFCCKVRAFLDYSGLSYSVVEVDSVLRQSIKWSPYKKVPSLLARRKDGAYVQLTESSMIISALSTYLLDPSAGIEKSIKFYQMMSFTDDNGHRKQDVINKYHRLNHNQLPKNYTKEWQE